MHPKALLDECASLIEQVFKFEHPADAVVARHFRENRSLGPRERGTLSDTVYTILRERLKLEWLARSGSGSKWRRLAILAFPGDRDFIKSALTEPEKTWLDHCDAVTDDDLMAPHRHNLPEWLATALKEQVREDFWPLVKSLEDPAPLDLRVNAVTDRRDDVLAPLLVDVPEITTDPTWFPDDRQWTGPDLAAQHILLAVIRVGAHDIERA